MPTRDSLTCSECAVLNCYRRDKRPPQFCLTETTDPKTVQQATKSYRGKGHYAKAARAAAEVEGTYYGKLTRVEEIVAFATRLGAKLIGIATCIGLIEDGMGDEITPVALEDMTGAYKRSKFLAEQVAMEYASPATRSFLRAPRCT